MINNVLEQSGQQCLPIYSNHFGSFISKLTNEIQLTNYIFEFQIHLFIPAVNPFVWLYMYMSLIYEYTQSHRDDMRCQYHYLTTV